MHEFNKHPATRDLPYPVQQQQQQQPSNTGKKVFPVDERRKQFKDTSLKRMGSIRTRRRIIMGQASTVSKTCIERASLKVNKCTSAVKSMGIGFLKCILKYATHDKGTCASCLVGIRVENLSSLPCGHSYCQPCLRQMTFIAMGNERMFPPRCCNQSIPFKTVLTTLASQEKVAFLNTTEEFKTAPTERWYCPATTCGKWIPPKMLRNQSRFQKCPYCRTKICSRCRDQDHAPSECTKDPGIVALLEQAKARRWQRCYNCRVLVEATGGCGHMTCRCRAEFCYTCGGQWPRCRCITQALDGPAGPYNDANDAVFGIAEKDRPFVLAAVIGAEREEAELKAMEERLRQEEQNQQLWRQRVEAIRQETDVRAGELKRCTEEIGIFQQERKIVWAELKRRSRVLVDDVKTRGMLEFGSSSVVAARN